MPVCLGNSARSDMNDDGKDYQGGNRPANDDGLDGPSGDGKIVAPSQKLDRVVLHIARLIGRQMARDDFERLRAANDNQPRDAGHGNGETDKD